MSKKSGKDKSKNRAGAQSGSQISSGQNESVRTGTRKNGNTTSAGKSGAGNSGSSPTGVELPYSDIPLLLAVTLSPLVVGSIVVTGFTPGDMTLFSLAALGTFCAHFAGKSYSELAKIRAARIPGLATTSLEELKRGINKQSVEAERETRQLKLRLIAGIAGIFAIIAIVALNTHNLSGALLFAAAFILLFTRRADTPTSARGVILHVLLTVFVMMLLGAIGVFCQAVRIHLQTFVLGIVPGSLLAAAVVAQNSAQFDSAYWTRNIQVTRNGKASIRPGKLTQLFTLLLIAGPLIIFVLTPAQILPPPLMLGVLPVVWTPKLASGFSTGSVPDKVIALATAKIAAVASICMMVAGYLAAN